MFPIFCAMAVSGSSFALTSIKERAKGGTPHRRHSRPDRPPCAASAPINVIRPGNIMTSNYSFHGNTLALHGSALSHPNISPTVFVLVRKLFCIPAGLSKVILNLEMSERFTKVILHTQCGVLPRVPGWNFRHRLCKTVPDVKRARMKHCK